MNAEHDFKRPKENQGALINTNKEALKQYKKMKARMAEIDKINKLENDISEIKDMLAQLLGKK